MIGIWLLAVGHAYVSSGICNPCSDAENLGGALMLAGIVPCIFFDLAILKIAFGAAK